MEASQKESNRELTPGFYKARMLKRVKDFEQSPGRFKQMVAERADVTVQMVRLWFREGDLKNAKIEVAAWECLEVVKTDFLKRQKERSQKLEKLQ